jgi:hypothetical protein
MGGAIEADQADEADEADEASRSSPYGTSPSSPSRPPCHLTASVTSKIIIAGLSGVGSRAAKT